MKPNTLLMAALACFALIGAVAQLLREPPPPPRTAWTKLELFGGVQEFADADDWFQAVRAACNPEAIDGILARHPPPPSDHGRMYLAACHALAGHLDSARVLIDGLPGHLRPQGAGVVISAGYPQFRIGRYQAIAPMMELGLEYWPTFSTALFTAGAARMERGDFAGARPYLESYLADGGSGMPSAEVDRVRDMLARVDSAEAAAAR